MALKIEDLLATYGKRDDDGDRDFRASAKVTASGDGVVDMVRLSVVFKSAAGLPVLTEDSDEDVDLEDGDSETVEAYTYSKYNDLTDATAEISVLAYEQNRKKAGSASTKGIGDISGSAERVEIGSGLSLSCWSLKIGAADSDGDCKVQFIATLHNDSDRMIDKAVACVQLLNRKDKEFNTLEDSAPIPAKQSKTIEDYTYISANKANKEIRAVVTVEAYSLVGSETKEVALTKGKKSRG